MEALGRIRIMNVTADKIKTSRKKTDSIIEQYCKDHNLDNIAREPADLERNDVHIEDSRRSSPSFVDINYGNVVSEITAEERAFLQRAMMRARSAKRKHSEYVTRYKKYNKIIGTITAILSLLAGSTGIGSLLGIQPEDPGFAVILTVSIVSLSASLLGTIQSTLSFENKAISHKSSVTQFSDLITKISHFLVTPGMSRKDVELFTNQIVIEMSVIEGHEEYE